MMSSSRLCKLHDEHFYKVYLSGHRLGLFFESNSSCLTGDSLYMWDPHGHYLTASTTKPAAPSGAAKQYQHVGNHSNLTQRFADQFSVWDFGGLDITTRVNCTLIRLPLRSAVQAENSDLSKVTFNTHMFLPCSKV